MNFFETRMGHKYFQSDLPKLIRAIERVADAMEKPKEPDSMLNSILQFARETDFDTSDNSRTQLKSLWTAYCILNGYEAETASYDNDIQIVWNAVIQNRKILGSSDEFDDFDCFTDFMSEDLV